MEAIKLLSLLVIRTYCLRLCLDLDLASAGDVLESFIEGGDLLLGGGHSYHFGRGLLFPNGRGDWVGLDRRLVLLCFRVAMRLRS
jgi:hypothetical protein